MLNKATLIGNLGIDPETKYLPSGDALVNFTIATNRRWKDKNGEKLEETEWHRVTMFGKLAEIAGKYLKKGSKVYIEGRIKTSKYQKDGVDVYITCIIADHMVMLGSNHSEKAHVNCSDQKEESNYSAKPGDFYDDIPF